MEHLLSSSGVLGGFAAGRTSDLALELLALGHPSPAGPCVDLRTMDIFDWPQMVARLALMGS